MKVGDRVRVKASVVVYHNPENRNKPCDIKGMEGEIFSFADHWEGKEISANFPVKVKFSKRFMVHLRQDEIEVISS
ncbi:MAG: ferredoxin--nitrite reductase [Cyanothece sp. SIO2G6]|nr:ferredoxin--nitrite reductase [Cyanothece sp. SIO2G6]